MQLNKMHTCLYINYSKIDKVSDKSTLSTFLKYDYEFQTYRESELVYYNRDMTFQINLEILKNMFIFYY